MHGPPIFVSSVSVGKKESLDIRVPPCQPAGL